MDNDPNPETTRRVTHLLLDLATAYDQDTQQLPAGAFEMVMRELSEIGAVTATFDDEDPNVPIVVDMGPLLGAVGLLLGMFVEYATTKSEVDRLAVINTIRESVDAVH